MIIRVFLLFVFTISVNVVEFEQLNNHISNKIENGIWIQKDFNKKLVLTKSIRKAQLTDSNFIKSRLRMFGIYKNSNRVSVNFTNLHEGVSYKTNKIIEIKNNEFIFITEIDKNEYDSVFFHFHGHFAILKNSVFSSKINVDTFVKVSEFKSTNKSSEQIYEYFSDYLNSIVLLGKYIDVFGNTYRFTSKREAIWPNMRFNYDFQKSFIEGNINDAIIINKPKYLSYLFQWEKGVLYLYLRKNDFTRPMGCDLLHKLYPVK